MKEVIERCNWLVNKCNDKAITPDVKDDFRYLLEEIERQKEIIRQLDIKNLELTTIIRQIEDIYTSLQFSAPENMYIFINELGEILKGSDKE